MYIRMKAVPKERMLRKIKNELIKPRKLHTALTVQELDTAEAVIIRFIQS